MARRSQAGRPAKKSTKVGGGWLCVIANAVISSQLLGPEGERVPVGRAAVAQVVAAGRGGPFLAARNEWPVNDPPSSGGATYGGCDSARPPGRSALAGRQEAFDSSPMMISAIRNARRRGRPAL